MGGSTVGAASRTALEAQPASVQQLTKVTQCVASSQLRKRRAYGSGLWSPLFVSSGTDAFR
jgi:hypothetical protein